MKFEYKFIKIEDEDDEFEYCNTCQCPAPLCEFDNPDWKKKKETPRVLLCEICSSTNLGSEIRSHNEAVSPLALAQTLNFVLDKISMMVQNGK